MFMREIGLIRGIPWNGHQGEPRGKATVNRRSCTDSLGAGSYPA